MAETLKSVKVRKAVASCRHPRSQRPMSLPSGESSKILFYVLLSKPILFRRLNSHIQSALLPNLPEQYICKKLLYSLS
jgi:hypothetical protein